MRTFITFTFSSILLLFASCVGRTNAPMQKPVASYTTQDAQEYNQSLRTILDQLIHQRKPAQWSGTWEMDGKKIRIDPGTDRLLQLNPTKFDELEIISKPEGSGQILHHVSQAGWGIPMVFTQEWRKEKGTAKKLFPLNGRHLPATAILDHDQDGTVVLRFIHTRNLRQTKIHGEQRNLAYDLSTPLHRSMGQRFLHNMAFRGLINSDRYLDDTGIYLPDVYDPKKIPVVFVHGLKSDPHIWQNAMNEILRDPVLREKYQCWYFLYPTGLPVYSSAEKLRRMLYVARDHYDPSRNNPNMNRMVLVGHSMGGIISRMQAVDSESHFYDSFFTKPIDTLKVQPLTRQLVREAMYFDRVPFVKRTVFVASPHQGSSIAEIPIVRAFSMLVDPTSALDQVTMDIRLNAADALHPDLWKFKNLGCRSTQTLSPEHPILKALGNSDVQVPYHSIIAAEESTSDLWDTSDGIVAYWSSHVPKAQSECLVRGSHSCTRLPEVSEEILRILRLHLK